MGIFLFFNVLNKYLNNVTFQIIFIAIKQSVFRMMKKLSLLLWLILLNQLTIAQDAKGTIIGSLISQNTLNWTAHDIQLYLPKLKQIRTLDSNGTFEIPSLPFGIYSIHIRVDGNTTDSFIVDLNQASVNIGSILINVPESKNDAADQENIPSVALEFVDNSDEDDGILGKQNISILLNSSGVRDPFLSASGFIFSQFNVRPRGYDRTCQQVYINSMLMNDVISGNPVWAQWGGLNDVIKNPTNTYGIAAHQQAIGLVNGSTVFTLNAAENTKQDKFSFSLSNRSYDNRLMYTHHTGLQINGWAFSFSASRRWAQEGYVAGTSFDAYSGYISIAKVLNTRHQITLNIIAAESQRARSGAAIEEVFALAQDNYYNPNWGWQAGKKRNAKNSEIFQPIVLLQHHIEPSDKTKITNSISIQTGYNQATSLDWYNAIDPRPDYYRNLPSYYQSSNPNTAENISQTLKNNPEKLQIDWARFYEANSNNIETLHGLNGNAGDSLRAKRSLYAIGADVEQMRKINFAHNIIHKHSDKIIWSGGIQGIVQSSTFYRQLEDLLGGDYFLNYNMFAAQQFVAKPELKQNDLIKPNRAVLKGEKYRYNYTFTINKAWAWGQLETNFKRVSLFAALSAGYTSYIRNGLFQNGLFAQNSFGKSTLHSFYNFTSKSGITYKINGRNYLLLNGFLSQEDPGVNNVFIAPRTRNQTIEKPSLQQTQSVEAGYIMHAPRLNIRTIGYATDIKNRTNIQRFYNDDPEYQSFVNFVMENINIRFIGTELAVEYAINTMLSINVVAAIGQAFYTNRPKVTVYNDNDTNISPKSKEVFIKNYYLGVGPQSAYTVGFNYNSKKFWYFKMNANYFDRNYVSVNPSRRSVEAAELLDKNNPVYAKIFDQEKLPSFYTLDMSFGKSIRLHNLWDKIGYKTSVYLNIGINNVLNNRSIKSNGYEQLRFDFSNNNPDKFPTKYTYAMGRTFFANISLKF